jgi:hypothetical protein
MLFPAEFTQGKGISFCNDAPVQCGLVVAVVHGHSHGYGDGGGGGVGAVSQHRA